MKIDSGTHSEADALADITEVQQALKRETEENEDNNFDISELRDGESNTKSAKVPAERGRKAL